LCDNEIVWVGVRQKTCFSWLFLGIFSCYYV